MFGCVCLHDVGTYTVRGSTMRGRWINMLVAFTSPHRENTYKSINSHRSIRFPGHTQRVPSQAKRQCHPIRSHPANLCPSHPTYPFCCSPCHTTSSMVVVLPPSIPIVMFVFCRISPSHIRIRREKKKHLENNGNLYIPEYHPIVLVPP